MRRGTLEYCVLSIIAKGEVYPPDIINQLEKANLLVVHGTLYPLLTRLKNAGLLSYRWQESPKGPPRKYYSLTDLGTKFHGELHETWQNLVQAVIAINQSSAYTSSESNRTIKIDGL